MQEEEQAAIKGAAKTVFDLAIKEAETAHDRIANPARALFEQQQRTYEEAMQEAADAYDEIAVPAREAFNLIRRKLLCPGKI